MAIIKENVNVVKGQIKHLFKCDECGVEFEDMRLRFYTKFCDKCIRKARSYFCYDCLLCLVRDQVFPSGCIQDHLGCSVEKAEIEKYCEHKLTA